MGGDMDPDVLRELADVKEAIKQGNLGEASRDGDGVGDEAQALSLSPPQASRAATATARASPRPWRSTRARRRS